METRDAEVKQSVAMQYVAQQRPKPFEQSWAVYDTTYNQPLIVLYADKEHATKQAARWNSGKFKESDKNRLDSLKTLREMLHPGDTVSTILRHVSRSGMSRRISLIVSRDGELVDITWDAARAMGETVKNRSGYVQDAGIEVGGCGMDMGFHIVYNLSRTLFPEGFTCAGEKCGSSDHHNHVNPPAGTCIEHAQRKPKGTCTDLNCKPWIHTGDGGYALLHRWL